MGSSSPTFIILTALEGHGPATLNALQSFLAPFVHQLTLVWLAVWCTALVIAVRTLVHKLRFPEDDTSIPMRSFHYPLPSFPPRVRMIYRRIFSVSEIEHSLVLKWLYGAMLFGFFTTFSIWVADQSTTVESAQSGAYMCWSYFQHCTWLYVLHAPPFGYSYTTVYMLLYAVILGCVYAMWKSSWTAAHAGMLLLFGWKMFVMFVLTASIQGGPNYHHLIMTSVLLFLPFKEFFARVVFVMLYFLAAIIKLDESWILGEYFTSLQTGLPLFGNAFAPLFTNAVIGMQIVLGPFLLSSRRVPQRTALYAFTLFHVYSGILIGYTYPVLVLSMLWILFGPLFRPATIPISKRSIIGWLAIVMLFAFHTPGHLIPGDQRLTEEGGRFGLSLFDANHQCVSSVTVYATSSTQVPDSTWTAQPRQTCGDYICLAQSSVRHENGYVVTRERWESTVSWQRCRSYTFWSRAKQQHCSDPGIERVAMQFDNSIDGGPFYRIIDEKNICSLTYSSLTHNPWIKTPPEAPIVGYPLKNVFRYQGQGSAPLNDTTARSTSTPNIIALNELVGNDPADLTPLQKQLKVYFPLFVFFWRVVWITMLLLLIHLVWRAVQRRR